MCVFWVYTAPCLSVFPLRGGFCSLFYFIIKKTLFLHLSPRLHLSSRFLTERIIQFEDSAEEVFVSPTTRHYLQPPIQTHPPVWGPELLPSAGQWREEVCSGVQWCSRGVRLQWGSPQGPLQQCLRWAPQMMEDEGARPPDVWGICWVSGMFPSYGGWCASGGGRRSCRAPSGGWRSHSVIIPVADKAAAHPGIPGLVRKQEDPPMRSVRAAGIPRLASPKAAVPAPEPAPFPGAHRARSIPGSPQSPLRSVSPRSPLQSPFREPTEFTPEPAPFPGAHRARSVPGAHRVRSWNRSSQVVVVCSTLVASYSAGPTLVSCFACPALAPLSAYSSGTSSTPRVWPTPFLDIFLF